MNEQNLNRNELNIPWFNIKDIEDKNLSIDEKINILKKQKEYLETILDSKKPFIKADERPDIVKKVLEKNKK